MGSITDFAKNQINKSLDKSLERRNRAAQLAQYCSEHYDELSKNPSGWPINSVEIFGEWVENSELRKIVDKLDHENGCAYFDTAKGRVWMFVKNERFSNQIFFKGCTSFSESCESEAFSSSSESVPNNMEEAFINMAGLGNNAELDKETVNKLIDLQERAERNRAFTERNRANELKSIKEKPIPSGEELKIEIKDCIANYEGCKDSDFENAWETRTIKLISRIPMPKAEDFSSTIKEIDRYISKGDYTFEDAWQEKKEEIVEYAKENYSNHPAVKQYFNAVKEVENKIQRHNSGVTKKRLIVWSVWLVATVVFFAMSYEWYHYVFAVVGSVVIAIVAFILSVFVWDKKDAD